MSLSVQNGWFAVVLVAQVEGCNFCERVLLFQEGFDTLSYIGGTS